MAGFFASSKAHAINVTVSVTPLAGIIKPLLAEDDQLEIILKPGQSPHAFQMSPADMKKLANTDLLVWVGTPVDIWIAKPLENTQVTNLAMHDLPNLLEYPVRKGGIWERHEHHAEAGQDEHDDHPEHHVDAHHHDHESEDKNEHETEHSEDKHNMTHKDSMRMDGHLWMSYHNAVQLIKAVSIELQKKLPEQKNDIAAREQAWLEKLAKADESLSEQLNAVKEMPYLVLHDAYQYFEKRYQLNGAGSIQLNPTVSPSLKRVAELREKIAQGEVQCVFKEPQFPAKRIAAVTRGMDVNIGSLDPMGLNDAGDYLLYDAFLKTLGQQFINCLQP